MGKPFCFASIQINVNQTEAGSKSSLAPFYEMRIRNVIVIVYAGNQTNVVAV